jgi:4-amino-4-deoxy-L-arabinose transferase-like glycosyltransferase
VVAVRAAVFPFAQNFYGDPAMRLRALTDWMAHPFFLRSFVGAKQFGPLHLYLLALGQWIHHDLDNGPRLLSLVFGGLTAFPLFSLTERRFGAVAALISTLGLAIYPLHIQTSTTATSEAVFLFFLLAGLSLLDRATEGSRSALAGAAALLACACAVRYDGFLYAPLSVLWLVRPLREGKLGRAAAVGYVLGVAAVPALLCLGNWIDLGDPLFIVRYINEDHTRMAHVAVQWMGRWTYAGYCLGFWPANLAWELSPPIALGVAIGAYLAARERRGWDLLLLAGLPAAFFSFEGAALLRFHPLARFTLPTAVLLLPYAGHGLLAVGRWLPARTSGFATAVAVVAGMALPTYFAWRTIGRDDGFADTLRPLSPISNLPPDLSAAADWVRTHAAGQNVEVETNWLYEELPIQFYGQLGGARVFTPREGPPPPGFEPPDVLVLPKESDLIVSGRGRLEGDTLVRGEQRFSAVTRLGKVIIFRRAPQAG